MEQCSLWLKQRSSFAPAPFIQTLSKSRGNLQEAGTGFHFHFWSYHLRMEEAERKQLEVHLKLLSSLWQLGQGCLPLGIFYSTYRGPVQSDCIPWVFKREGRRLVAVLLRCRATPWTYWGLAHQRLSAVSSDSHPQFEKISEHYQFLSLLTYTHTQPTLELKIWGKKKQKSLVLTFHSLLITRAERRRWTGVHMTFSFPGAPLEAGGAMLRSWSWPSPATMLSPRTV